MLLPRVLQRDTRAPERRFLRSQPLLKAAYMRLVVIVHVAAHVVVHAAAHEALGRMGNPADALGAIGCWCSAAVLGSVTLS